MIMSTMVVPIAYDSVAPARAKREVIRDRVEREQAASGRLGFDGRVLRIGRALLRPCGEALVQPLGRIVERIHGRILEDDVRHLVDDRGLQVARRAGPQPHEDGPQRREGGGAEPLARTRSQRPEEILARVVDEDVDRAVHLVAEQVLGLGRATGGQLARGGAPPARCRRTSAPSPRRSPPTASPAPAGHRRRAATPPR